MSKKTDFLRSQQNRDKHPESGMAGSAASVTEQQARQPAGRMKPRDKQEGNTPGDGNDQGAGRGTRGGNAGGGSR